MIAMYYGRTDIGKVRKENQDKFDCFETGGAVCLVVCDGMGGAKGGKVASDVCVKTVRKVLTDLLTEDMTEQDVVRAVKTATETANKTILALSENDESLSGMGTTLALVIIRDNRFFYTHLGDSRIYAIDDAAAVRLTKDHSFVQEMVDLGKLTPEEAENHPQKNIITNAVGIHEEVEQTVKADFLNGRKLLLCSDGLSNMLSDLEIFDIVFRYKVTEDCVSALVSNAINKGGTDNITAVIYGG